MSTTYLEKIQCVAGRSVANTVVRCINYGKNKNKTMDGELVTAVNCNINTAYAEMLLVQQGYEMLTGKNVNPPCGVDEKTGDTITAPVMYVICQSFKPGEVTPKAAHEIGLKFAEKYLGDKFQYTVNTHTDKPHIHNHIYFNAVQLDCQHKFNNDKKKTLLMRELNDQLCLDYGLSIVMPGDERRSKTYSKCAASSFRECLKNDIDQNIKLAENYDEFISLMRKDYAVVTDGKYLRFRHLTNGQQRFIRSYTLGTEYDEEQLHRAFKSNRIPSRKLKMNFVQTLKAKTKLKQDKEKSYTQRLVNIKALFFTLGVVNDNDIKQYSDIVNCTSNAANAINLADSKLHECETEMNYLNELIVAIDVVSKKQAVIDEYSRVILKTQYYSNHESDIDMYNVALAKLTQNGISPTAEALQQLHTAKSTTQQIIFCAKNDLEQLKGKFEQISTAKNIVDCLHSNSAVLASKKDIGYRTLLS